MSYFDVKISQIPFGSSGKPIHGRNASNTEDWFPVHVEPMPFDEWERLYSHFIGEVDDGCLCFVELADNGIHGDGIRFRICAGDSKRVLVETGVPEQSLDTLIAALTAIRMLRNAQGE